jgi:hypothetical protein
MPDRPRDIGEDRSIRNVRGEDRSDNSVVIAIVLAAVVALLLIFGARMFNANTDKVDINTTPPSIDSPTTSETQKP